MKRKTSELCEVQNGLREGIEVGLNVQTQKRVRWSWDRYDDGNVNMKGKSKRWNQNQYFLIFYSDQMATHCNANFPLNRKQKLKPQFSVFPRLLGLSVSQWFPPIWFPVVWAPTCLPGLFAGALLGRLIPVADLKPVKGFLSGLPPHFISFHRRLFTDKTQLEH